MSFEVPSAIIISDIEENKQNKGGIHQKWSISECDFDHRNRRRRGQQSDREKIEATTGLERDAWLSSAGDVAARGLEASEKEAHVTELGLTTFGRHFCHSY